MPERKQKTEAELMHEIRKRDGAKGGQKTLEHYGVKHFVTIGKKRWEKKKKK